MKSELLVHVATVGFQVKRITEPVIRERADKVYLVTHPHDDKAAPYLEKISIMRTTQLIYTTFRIGSY